VPRLVHRIIQGARPALFVAAAATLLSVVLLFRPGLREDYRIESFVASHDESYLRFRRFMEEFSSNEVAIIAIEAPNVLSPESVALLAEIGEKAEALPSVQQVLSIANVPTAVRALLGDRIWSHPLFLDNIINRDHTAAAVLIQIAGEEQPGEVRKRTVAALRSLTADTQAAHPEAHVVLAGPYVTLIDMFDYVQRDLLVFSFAAFGLLCATLWVVFRRTVPMVYAVLVGASATLCTLGLAVVFGWVTSLITQMIVILVAVLSVASCVHLAAAAEEIRLENEAGSRRDQAARTLRRMLAPCAAVVTTTAVGFGALCTSSISPVRLLGALIVFGLGWSLVTALCGSVEVAGRTPSPTARTHLPRWLRRVGAWSDRRRWWVFGLFAASTAFCAAGIGRLSFESAFLENFRPHSSVRQSYEFIGDHFAPVGSLEVVVQTVDGGAVLSPQTLQTADAFAADVVRQFDPIRKSQSVGDLLTLFGAGLPQSALDLRLRLALIQAAGGPDNPLRAFLNADRTAMRIQFRAIESHVSVPNKLRMAGDVRRMAEQAFGPGFRVEVTGLYYFYARLIDGMVRDQYRSVAITVPAVFLVMALLLRSARVALVAVIPNLLPMVFCLGVMGWSGIPVNMTTAMMLSVTFGIAVDDTLHYLWRFRAALRETGDYSVAVLRAHGSVGRACVFTTVVIAGGFWILVLSEFLPTAYFGGLVGFTMLATLAADLVLLPALLTTLRPFPDGR